MPLYILHDRVIEKMSFSPAFDDWLWPGSVPRPSYLVLVGCRTILKFRPFGEQCNPFSLCRMYSYCLRWKLTFTNISLRSPPPPYSSNGMRHRPCYWQILRAATELDWFTCPETRWTDLPWMLVHEIERIPRKLTSPSTLALDEKGIVRSCISSVNETKCCSLVTADSLHTSQIKSEDTLLCSSMIVVLRLSDCFLI